MKSKFFTKLGCISSASDNNLEPQETIQQIQPFPETHPSTINFRFSKFKLISLKAAQEKQLKDLQLSNNISITPDMLQKQLSCLKKVDTTKNNNTECNELTKYHQGVEEKEIEVPISKLQNKNNKNFPELDELLRELYMYCDQEVTQSSDIYEVNIPGELNDKENVTISLSPMLRSNIVGGSFPPIDNIPTESSALLGNSSSDILSINENL